MSISVVIPTYGRGAIVLETVRRLLAAPVRPLEIILVDQTDVHPGPVQTELRELDASGSVRWLRGLQPNIPRAMNAGLLAARGTRVLYLDDDIIPDPALISSHESVGGHAALVAGQVLQPGQQTLALRPGEPFRFNSPDVASVHEFMGGNFSLDRDKALAIGGFDENFVGAAYRFEAEFAHRFVQDYGPIRYEPSALIHHLAVSTGGTRAHGHHLRTIRPGHSAGEYYFLLKTKPEGWFQLLLRRPFRAVRTRHHLTHPWWIPLSLVAEFRGLLLARELRRTGPKLIDRSGQAYREAIECA